MNNSRVRPQPMDSFDDVKKRLVASKDLPWVTALWGASEREAFFKRLHAPESRFNVVVDNKKNGFMRGNSFQPEPEKCLTELLKPVRVYPRVPTRC